EGVSPVACEDRGVLFGSAASGADHDAVRLAESGDGAAARAGGVDHQLSGGGDAVKQRGEFGPRNVGTFDVEFVVDAVERAMADQRDYERVARLRAVRDFSELYVDLLAGGINQGVRFTLAARLFNASFEISGEHLETLFVVRLAPLARNSDE